MIQRLKALLLLAFTCLLSNVQCHELLIDFLDFNEQNGEVFVTKTCVDHLNQIKNGIAQDEVWARKGLSISVAFKLKFFFLEFA